MNWTDERVERLTKLWAEGLSASQIAAQLGGVTRNAVIGKVHRLNLPGRAKSGGSTPPRARRSSAALGTSSNFNARPASSRISRGGPATALRENFAVEGFHDVEPAADVVVPIARKLPLIDLTERTCKWPIGDPMQEEFHFCGNDSDDGAPYCKYHARLAFQPSAERRRAR